MNQRHPWQLFLRLACIAALLYAVLAAPAWADSGRGKHKKIYAVPCPTKVTIDGDLKEWDLSAQLNMYIVQETSEMISAKFAIMYDEQALYLGADVRDDTPMMNRFDPKAMAERGWDADSCQFRILVDPKQGYPITQGVYAPVRNPSLVHLTMWYYTDRKEPVLQMYTGMDYQVPRKEWTNGVVPTQFYQAAYKKKADGHGYTFEYRIPWDTLGAQAPLKGGDLVAGTVQLNFSTPDGLSAGGGWLYDVMSGPGFTFQSTACWGKIIFSETGHLPREMVEEGVLPSPPMPLSFTYDLPSEAEASVQLLDASGMVVRTLVASAARKKGANIERWDGLDDSGKPLAAGAYTWKGLYHQPLKTKFIMSVHNSGQPPYKTDDNTGGWGGDHGVPTTACAINNGMLLAWNACESGWGIIRTDLKGKKLWGSKHNATDLATDDKRIFGVGEGTSVRVYDLVDSRPIPWGNGKMELELPAGGTELQNQATGVAYVKGQVFVTLKARDLIAVYDAAQGNLLRTMAVPAPERLTACADDSLLVISNGSILRLRGEKTAPFLTTNIDHPSGLALDARGNVYVANRGALQNITVFSPDGAYVKSIGKTGGRPRVGRYSSDGILEPGGMAVDSQGSLWVAETLDGPKRISVWETTTGKLQQEFFGGSAYSTFVSMDPKNATEAFCHDVIWKIDLDKGTWSPYSTAWRSTEPNMVAETNDLHVITARNGKQYGWGHVNVAQTLYMRVGDVFKPILGGIPNYKGGPYIAWPPYPLFTDREKYPDGAYNWQDSNNDQIVQANEVAPMPDRVETLFNYVDENLNLYSSNGYIIRPLRIEADGRPVYDLMKHEPIPNYPKDGERYIAVNPSGSLLTVSAPAGSTGWSAWSLDGKMQWGYKESIHWQQAVNMPVATAGKLWGPTMPLGVAGEFTGVPLYFGPVQLYTRDGQFVGMIFRDGRTGGGLGPDYVNCEFFNAQMVKPEGMNRYFLLAGDQDGRITEILGLDTVKRLPGGVFNLTPEMAKTVATAQAEYAALLAKSSRLEIARGRKSLDTAKAVRKVVDDSREFTVKAAYDEQNLYLNYEVSSPYELTNSIPDTQTIFKGGNAIDLQIATDSSADTKRKTPAPGDVRLLITRQNGKPLAVLYTPKVRGFAGQPIVLTSPTGKESFDDIKVIPDVSLEYTPRAGGFTALVTVPLRVLGWAPKAGATVKLDIGFIFAKNATGFQAALRSYWANNSFTANIVDDLPHESRLEPGEWGTAGIE